MAKPETGHMQVAIEQHPTIAWNSSGQLPTPADCDPDCMLDRAVSLAQSDDPSKRFEAAMKVDTLLDLLDLYEDSERVLELVSRLQRDGDYYVSEAAQTLELHASKTHHRLPLAS